MESRPSRPQRNRRHSRRAWPPDDDTHHHLRPMKRLFTPEIKRMLKDWLIRRRENPYPSRDEKKRLAVETGLTYTQICNWFANWRRKLKNSEHEKAKKSWGHLIKNYNTNARGNVEQFSISSEDSIWEEGVVADDRGGRQTGNEGGSDEDHYTASETETECDVGDDESDMVTMPPTTPYLYVTHTPKFYMEPIQIEKHSNFKPDENAVNTTTAQCHQISSTTRESAELEEMLEGQQKQEQEQDQEQQEQPQKFSSSHRTKYKQQMMEKYLRDTNERNYNRNSNDTELEKQPIVATAEGRGTELSKWLESAVKFRPNKNNYFIEWNKKRNKLERKQRPLQIQRNVLMSSVQQLHQQITPPPAQLSLQQQQTIHHKDELDAAEALANLAFNCRRRMMDAHVFHPSHANNVIPSS